MAVDITEEPRPWARVTIGEPNAVELSERPAPGGYIDADLAPYMVPTTF